MLKKTALKYSNDSTGIFECIRPLGDAVFLDSGYPASTRGRFDIISAAPEQTWFLDSQSKDSDGFFVELEQALAHQPNASAIDPNCPFHGGLIGQFSYDLGKTFETLPCTTINDITYPLAWVGLYQWAVVVDHQQQTTQLVIDTDACSLRESDLLSRLSEAPAAPKPFSLTHSFRNDISEQVYKDAIGKVLDYIQAGDCYQVNFTQRFSSSYLGDPWNAYKALRKASPTPFAAYMENAHGCVLSLSPERLLRVQDARVETQPIKGTSPRFLDPEADRASADALSCSEKNRAENLMIVDLLRNDLSKVCELHSVKVPKLFELQSYQNVHHLVSTVEGKLPSSTSNLELLKACFPGGSITGAPKIRAMEIIDELETYLRSIYCGSVGYISHCGTMDLNITIRTLLCERQNIYCWAGGGIVSDSTSDSEYQESLTKITNLLKCLEALQGDE